MNPKLKILHLEDDKNDVELVKATLMQEGVDCDIKHVETRDEYIRAIEHGGFDLIFVDYNLPSFDGMTAMDIAKEKCPDIPVIFISGTMGEELAIETLKQGATDYVLKNRLSRLVTVVRRALKEAENKAKREKAAEALKKSQERLKFLIMSSPAVIYTCKASGNYGATFISDNVRDIMGFTPEDFVKNPSFWADNIHPDDRPRILEDLMQLYNKEWFSYEYRFMFKDGEYHWMRDELRLIRDEKGEPKEIIGYWADITERKKMKEEIKKRVKELEDFYEMAVGRELRMVELKEEIEELKEELAKYKK